MNRENLLRQLAQAELSIAEGKALIARQQQLIVESELDGDADTAEALTLLEQFLKLQQSREQNRAEILDALYALA